MSFSAGVFSINTTGQPVVTGTTISSTVFNALTADIATGLSTAILKDGTQTLTANIPMSSFKLTGLAVGSASTDSARFDQIQAGIQLGTSTYLTAVSGTNTIVGTATPTPAYTVGQRFWFIPAATNTGATTLNISSVGAGAVQSNAQALVGGELVIGVPVEVLVTAATPVFNLIGSAPFLDSRPIVVGGTDQTKKVRFEVDGLTTATTRVATVPDHDLTIGDAAVVATVQAASGTSITFTGIPAWVTELNLMLSGVSTNGTNLMLVQIGPVGGVETSGYVGSTASMPNAGATVATLSSTGVAVVAAIGAASVLNGVIRFTLFQVSTNTWGVMGCIGHNDAAQAAISGYTKPLAGVLTQLKITMVGGADTFDAGSFSLMYR